MPSIDVVRLVSALCAAVACAAVAAGCGGLQGDSFAEVDGEPIKKAAFDHWMRIATKAGEGSQEQRRTQVVELLVSHKWIEGEAADRGVKVSEQEIRRSYDQQKEQNFPSDEEFRKFLRESGQTEEDLRLQVRISLLSTGISEKVVEDETRISDAQVADYYAENRERFVQPERRDLRIVVTQSRSRAEAAKSALDRGASWRSVAREYSTDRASRSQGGKLAGQAEGSLPGALDEAVFGARRGAVVGPVREQSTFLVFEVERVRPERQQTLEQATETIRQTLQSERQQQTLQRFAEEFRRRWRARTECREEFATSVCSNGPDPTPTPTATPGQTR